MKPVYIINGFLDSGKTDFLRYTIDQPYFKTDALTLLIVCEEGENNYSDELLKRTSTVMQTIDEEDSFTIDTLEALDRKFAPERIIIEYNGMWSFRNLKLPDTWTIEQQISLIDASCFQLYFTNMKSLLADQIRKSDLILFNRCDGIKELAAYKRNVKAINQKADIIFEDENGEVDVTLDEELPFDISADPIELDGYGYAMFYLDALDHAERYNGKKIHFTALVARPDGFAADRFVPGRQIMTCCAQDIQFLGFVCEYDRAESLKERDWIDITASVEIKYMEEYESEGVVLKGEKIKTVEKPDKDIIDISQPQ